MEGRPLTHRLTTLCFAVITAMLLPSTSSVAQPASSTPAPAEAPATSTLPTTETETETAPQAATTPAAPVDEALIVQPGTNTAPVRIVDDTSLETWRTPLQALNEHFLGTASRPVRFDWRRSPAMFVLRVAEVIERNSFGQWQIGVIGRKAFGDLLIDGGINAFFAYETVSSQQLALTPFRQAGRPDHFQLEFNVGYALAEGVVTPIVSWLPPMEMALVAQAGVRYLIYTESFTGGRPFVDVARSLATPQLTVEEIERLESTGPEGMQIDPARLHALVGASLDVYVAPGVIVAPRAMVGVPLLSAVTASELGLFVELGLSIGYAL